MNTSTNLLRRLFVLLVAIIGAIVTIGIIRVAASPALQEILLDADAPFWPFTLELYMHEIDLRYSMMRYLTWLIPSLGFIGTVMGIMFALQYAGVPANAEADDFLYQVTSRLGVAFTTTLLALIMSAVLVLLQSLIQGKEERALNEAGQYCLDNLILRLGDGADGKSSSHKKLVAEA